MFTFGCDEQTKGGFIMGALRDRMFANMRLRNLSAKTIKVYLWHVREFTRCFGKAPDLLGEEEVRQYLLYLLDERKASWSKMNIGYSALKFFYVNTLQSCSDCLKSQAFSMRFGCQYCSFLSIAFMIHSSFLMEAVSATILHLP